MATINPFTDGSMLSMFEQPAGDCINQQPNQQAKAVMDAIIANEFSALPATLWEFTPKPFMQGWDEREKLRHALSEWVKTDTHFVIHKMIGAASEQSITIDAGCTANYLLNRIKPERSL